MWGLENVLPFLIYVGMRAAPGKHTQAQAQARQQRKKERNKQTNTMGLPRRQVQWKVFAGNEFSSAFSLFLPLSLGLAAGDIGCLYKHTRSGDNNLWSVGV